MERSRLDVESQHLPLVRERRGGGRSLLCFSRAPFQHRAHPALARELADVVKEFDAWAAKELDPLNASLAEKKLGPVKPPSREEWEKSTGKK